jgi:hypothetical protein
MSGNINHYHRCGQCGTEWGHGLSDPDGPDYAKAHDCPSCGRNQRWVTRWENELEMARFYAERLLMKLAAHDRELLS